MLSRFVSFQSHCGKKLGYQISLHHNYVQMQKSDRTEATPKIKMIIFSGSFIYTKSIHLDLGMKAK